MTLTDLLSRLRQLDEEMTPGPWRWEWDSCDCEGGVPCGHSDWPHRLQPHGISEIPDLPSVDATGIAILRNLLPALADVVEAAQIVVDASGAKPDRDAIPVRASVVLAAALTRLVEAAERRETP